jgi:hypothetical protein
MKSPFVSSKGLLVALLLSSMMALSGPSYATPTPGSVQDKGAPGGLDPREITPGRTMGLVRLGDSRKTVEHTLNDLKEPKRTKGGGLYSLTYKYDPPHTNCGGKQLSIVFHGTSKRSKAAYMVTTEFCFSTNDAGIQIFDRLEKLQSSYSVSCYHSETDGTRNPVIEDTDNSECELHSNGGYTYFSFASRDADPEQRIGVIAIASRKVD